MKQLLTGKTAIVTGASKGIGLAIARACLAEGAKVSICGRTQDSLDAALAELGGDAPADHVQGAICDVGDAEALAAYVEAAAGKLGGLFALVNNPSGFGATDDVCVRFCVGEEGRRQGI